MKAVLSIGVPGLILVALISYGLALLGEPQALWLWRDIFGVIQ